MKSIQIKWTLYCEYVIHEKYLKFSIIFIRILNKEVKAENMIGQCPVCYHRFFVVTRLFHEIQVSYRSEICSQGLFYINSNRHIVYRIENFKKCPVCYCRTALFIFKNVKYLKYLVEVFHKTNLMCGIC